MTFTFLDSLLISAFGLGLVFVVLIALSAVISLESAILKLFNKRGKSASEESMLSDTAPVVDSGVSQGALKLIDVDERTAAMIMAIVSDESGIPLSELQFKMIKALD